MIRNIILPVFAIAALSACSLKDFESEPVVVDTPAGQVTCQLYTQSMTSGDRAIDAPAGMAIPTADSYCKQEGMARK